MSSDVSNRRLLDILTVLKRHHLSRGMTPQKLKEILEDLGPTYVKLGQIMSMRSDMLPEAYCTELKKLRTEVKPLDFSLVKQVVEQELCRPLESVFSDCTGSLSGACRRRTSCDQSPAASYPGNHGK